MGDPLWYYKVLGLHCDGTNGSTTITDVKGKTVTVYGNAQISTAQYPALTGKTSSLYLDGSGDAISVPNSTDFTFSGDFSIRLRVRFSGGLGSNITLYNDESASGYGVLFQKNSSDKIAFAYMPDNAADKTKSGNLVSIVGATSVTTGVWYVFEVTRQGTTCRVLLDGVVEGSGTISSGVGVYNPGGYKAIGGRYYAGSQYANAYISEVEIYKGVATNTANYTPPSDPFPDEYVSVSGTTKDASGNFASMLVRVYRRDTGALVGQTVSDSTTGAYKIIAPNSGTTTPLKCIAVCHDPSIYAHYRVLGLHCDGTNGSTTFTDVKGKTVTANGNAQISTAQYPALTGKTSSGYLDGNGDYLFIADNADLELGAGDFTLRAKVRIAGYSPSYAGGYYFALFAKDASTGRSYNVQIIGTSSSFTTLRFNGFSDQVTYTTVDASFTFSLNTWYDIEVVRSGNLVYLFVDGSLLNAGGTAFSRMLQDTSTALKIGGHVYDGTYLGYLNGYISEVEIYKGLALHTADFTPSGDPFTSPATATENAIIYDDITPV